MIDPKTDPQTLAALKAITGATRVRVLVEHDDKGQPVYREGYVEAPNDQLQFTDEVGQYRIVPLKRVDDHGRAEVARKAKPGEAR